MPRLHFKGKVLVENYHMSVPFHELIPVQEKGFSATASLHDNLIVHGDNLATLKSLLPFYRGKIKCIYIDPPYNTGNENWEYNDNVNSPLIKDWLGKTVDRDDLTRHDKWLCMMMPRLKLLRELLREDGVIFVSIDDNEMHHLRCLMDEIFSERNFLMSLVWHHRKSKQNDIGVSLGHNYILGYTKNSQKFELKAIPVDESQFSNPDNDPRGRWTLDPMDAPNIRPNLTYEIVNPKTGHGYYPPKGRCWRFSIEKYEQALADGRIVFGRTGRAKPQYKRFLEEAREKGRSVSTIWQDVGTATNATEELNQIFDNKGVFQTPKPSDLIRKLILLSTEPDSIILDSFAGSGTTAHAVLAQNQEDGGNRRFILVECEDYADSTTAERVRRVIQGIPTAKDASLNSGLGGTFSYFKLGNIMKKETLIDGTHLPSWNNLSSYIFFTATGQEFDPTIINRDTGFIGETASHDVFLIYEPHVDKLKNLALSLSEARALPSGPKRKLVFAPAKYLDREFLHKYNIDFQQLPFQIYEAIDQD
ncbi:MAG: site-specific DNA-methyltransferase [Bacteroidetes bacterium]|nr:site-specific DNA-methyltransferase [Bacteroidota bacterium]MCY4233192.1 site-specific DNA-methyltransferase [Bacteroidota bacterium]